MVLTMNSSVSEEMPGTNAFEAHMGWEVQRQSLVGFAGYKFVVAESWSVIPEFHYVAVITPSVSLRYTAALSGVAALGIQGGMGVNFPPFTPAVTWIAACAGTFRIDGDTYVIVEARIIAPMLLSTTDYSVGGTLHSSRMMSLRKYPPIVLSLGYGF